MYTVSAQHSLCTFRAGSGFSEFLGMQAFWQNFCKWSRLRSAALRRRFVCSLIEAGSEFHSRYSARSTRAPGSPPATVFCARVWMSVRPPKGASGTVQSRAFAPEATLCVKNVKQSKVRWMRAVLASRTELVCASNATAVVPDCDTGHEGEFLIYANYGE